ncbi:hypothetical protein Zmor_013669 [Zophobas morio]|uniref:Uncharacterized protein n=1 Tax=Zophobas morio TaxID=2755281 RepID=A0AA38IDD8_9CUCU|nr:hypothetical protein Zmor_013669 [Zophobas morio]
MEIVKKYYLVVLLEVTFVVVSSQNTEIEAKYELTDKGYHFSYKTDDSERTEDGIVDETKGKNGLLVVSGSYSFVATNGNTYRVNFVADENGYRPVVNSEQASTLQRTPSKSQEKPRGPFRPYIGSAVLSSLVGGGIG